MKQFPHYIMLAVLAFSLCNCVATQQALQDDAKTSRYSYLYKDKIDIGSELVAAWHHYSLEKTPANKFVYKQYFPSTGVLTDYVTYTDASMSIKDGVAKQWMDDGALFVESYYKNGKLHGAYKKYSGEVENASTVGQYQHGLMTGLWKYKDANGKIRAECTYQNDQKHGPYRIYKDGKVITEGEYVFGETNTYSGKMIETTVDEMAYYKTGNCQHLQDSKIRKQCGDKQMLQKVYKTITYPTKARQLDIEGMAIIRFVVNKDGSISDIESIRGICKEIRDESIKVVRQLKTWEPGYLNGEPVKMQFNLPIKYRLE